MNESQRIDFETKLSYQEAAIEELQQALHKQYSLISNLEKSFKLLEKRFETATKQDLEMGPQNLKPPHY